METLVKTARLNILIAFETMSTAFACFDVKETLGDSEENSVST